MTDKIKTDKTSIIARAREEINEERAKNAVEELKGLYRQLASAKDVLSSIERKIELAEKKVNDINGI